MIFVLVVSIPAFENMTSQVERQADILSTCVNSLKIWKQLIDTHLDGQEKDAETEELQEIVKEYCLIDFNATKTSEACQEVVDYFGEDSADQNLDADELYKEKLGRKENFSGSFELHKIWKEVFMGVTDYDVEEVQDIGTQNEATEYEEMQDSIFYSNVFTPPVDPISKMVVKEPYKSKVCGHVYEYKFILQYIKSMKNKAKCPYIGCNNRNIRVSDLLEDVETKNKIKEYERANSQEPNNEEESDDE